MKFKKTIYRVIEREYNDHLPDIIKKYDFYTLEEAKQKVKELADAQRNYYGEPSLYFSYEIVESYEKVVVKTCWKTIDKITYKELKNN